MSTATRLQTLRAALHQQELDAMLVSGPENRRYLSGFTGTYGYLLISEAGAVLATDFRYVEQAARQAPEFRAERVSGKLGWLPKLASELGVRRIGFEPGDMTVGTHSAFQKAIAEADEADRPTLVEASDFVDQMRATKQESEMELLSRAIEITDQAFEEVASAIEPGVTEREVAWELQRAMREHGAEALAFDTIVGAGPNGAIPHHATGDRAIAVGEPVVIDMGARYEGYCADLTRTIFFGEPDEKFRWVYGTVLDAQTAAREGVRPGMTGAEVDAIARDVVSQAGHGEDFGHSLGHGIGLAVHELPHVGPRSDGRLEDGAVFTIEPGIYLSGWGGVRIEDVVVLENGRARVMSKAPKLEVRAP